MKFGTLCIIIIFILLFVYVAKTLASTFFKGYKDVRTAQLATNVDDMIQADQRMGKNGLRNRGIDIANNFVSSQDSSYDGVKSFGSSKNDSEDYEDLGEFTL